MDRKIIESKLGRSFFKDTSQLLIARDFIFLKGPARRDILDLIDLENKKVFNILIGDSEQWNLLIQEKFINRLEKIERYRMDPLALDKNKLFILSDSLTSNYKIQPIDKKIYKKLRKEEWSFDLADLYLNFDEFKYNNCLGYVAFYKDQIVGGASTYFKYKDGIEIQIDTKEKFQRRGIGQALGARLVLETLKKGLLPYWDAHSKASFKLAQKLGYKLDYSYKAYELYS